MTEDQNEPPLVLVLEDEPDVREILLLTLQISGFRVVKAENVREALDVIRDSVPAFMLVDINMPRVDGLSFVRTIRATMPEPLRDVPIVALSGLEPEEWRAKALSAGCNEFIGKPVDPNELMDVIRRYTT